MTKLLQVCGALCVSILIGIIFILYFSRKTTLRESFTDSNRGELTTIDEFENSKNSVFYIKFWAPWCGYCKKMESDWTRIYNDYNDKIVNKKRVKIMQIRDDNPILKTFTQMYGLSIDGFPTVIRMRLENGKPQIETYEKSRNYEAISSYIQNF